MRVRVVGRNDVFSVEEQRYAVRWMLRDQLGPLAERLDVVLCNRKTIPWIRKKVAVEDGVRWVYSYEYNCKADCVPRDDRPHSHRKFTIRIRNNLVYKSQLTTLAHEVRHIRQWALGELRESARQPSMVRWRKRVVEVTTEEMDVTWNEYASYPWEVDARKHERQIVERYQRHLRHVGLSF